MMYLLPVFTGWILAVYIFVCYIFKKKVSLAAAAALLILFGASFAVWGIYFR